jgi:molecular chaperone HscC
LLSRLKAPLTRAITDAGVRLMDIDEVILVGGATRLPVVSRFVSRLLKKFPAIGVNPDEAVALGAAVAAAMKARDKSIRELILTDVCPYSLGTDIAMRQSNGMTRAGVFAPIIERNTVIPASRVERFYTVSDGQRTIKVEILQGESPRSKDNVFLGELKIDVPPAPAGEEAVDVRYTYDVNGILEVEVTSVSTGGVQKAVIEKTPGALSKESIERRLIELAPLKLHPRERDANKYLLDKAERYYKITTGEIRRRVSFALNEFEAALDSQESRAVSSQADSLKKLLAAIDESMFEV